MILIKGGTFTMGCTSEQGEECEQDETPTHSVELSDFYMSKYEVSMQEFADFVEDTGYLTGAEKEGKSFCYDPEWWEYKDSVNWRHDSRGIARKKEDYSRYPVTHINWYDAIAYCEWLSEKEGATYRLPTEAEWEYAARGGNKHTGHKYAGSNTIDEVAWYSGNAETRIQPIGTKLPNELGLYDMSGNISEWCSDGYNKYTEEAKVNPEGDTSGKLRIIRGGTCFTYAKLARVTYRTNTVLSFSLASNGFRLVKTAP